MLRPKNNAMPTTKVLCESQFSASICCSPAQIIKHPLKMSAAPRTGFGISARAFVSIGKNASTIKIIPATMLIDLLSTLVAPANPMLLDDVSTAIAPINPDREVARPSAIMPLRIGT